MSHQTDLKIIDRLDITSALAPHRSQKIVFTNGCFDILHLGHVRYLQEAKAQGDLLFLGLNSDSSVRRLKGETRPIQSELDRAEILLSLQAVDFVSIFSEETPIDLIRQVRPDVLVKGGDWPVKDIVGWDFVQSYGGEVKSLSFVEDRSTTSIVNRILS